MWTVELEIIGHGSWNSTFYTCLALSKAKGWLDCMEGRYGAIVSVIAIGVKYAVVLALAN